MPASSDLADRQIITTPRTIFTMISGLFIGYVWVLTNIVTTDELDITNERVAQLTNEFTYHLEESTVWRLEKRKEDISDQRWYLRQRMNEPGGNTPDNRQRERDLQKREDTLKQQIDCLRKGGRYCLSQPTSG